MTLITHIDSSLVYTKATNLIKSAKKTLYVTMMMEEEWQTRSDEYKKLIDSKIDQGLQIKRIGFGSKGLFEKWKTYLNLDSSNYEFRFISDMSLAQRMIIVDKHEMIFAIYKNATSIKKTVFYTRYKPLVKVFLDYFQSSLIKSSK